MYTKTHGDSDSLVMACPTSSHVNILRPNWTPGTNAHAVVQVQVTTSTSSDGTGETKDEDDDGPERVIDAVAAVADFDFVGPLVGHTSGGLVVASAAGKWIDEGENQEQVLLTCAADGSALAWVVDVAQASSREASEVRFHSAGISAAAVSPDSCHFMTGGADGSLVIALV